MSSFVGKVIAVTGAASGIGRATASILHSWGADLALSDISANAIVAFASELSSTTSTQKVTYRAVDVTDTLEVNDWFRKLYTTLEDLMARPISQEYLPRVQSQIVRMRIKIKLWTSMPAERKSD